MAREELDAEGKLPGLGIATRNGGRNASRCESGNWGHPRADDDDDDVHVLRVARR